MLADCVLPQFLKGLEFRPSGAFLVQHCDLNRKVVWFDVPKGFEISPFRNVFALRERFSLMANDAARVPKQRSLQKNQQILLQGLLEVSGCSDGMRNIS